VTLLRAAQQLGERVEVDEALAEGSRVEGSPQHAPCRRRVWAGPQQVTEQRIFPDPGQLTAQQLTAEAQVVHVESAAVLVSVPHTRPMKMASSAPANPGKLPTEAGGLPAASRTSAARALGTCTLAATLGGISAWNVIRPAERSHLVLTVPRTDGAAYPGQGRAGMRAQQQATEAGGPYPATADCRATSTSDR
jgi:hypothetical protein